MSYFLGNWKPLKPATIALKIGHLAFQEGLNKKVPDILESVMLFHPGGLKRQAPNPFHHREKTNASLDGKLLCRMPWLGHMASHPNFFVVFPPPKKHLTSWWLNQPHLNTLLVKFSNIFPNYRGKKHIKNIQKQIFVQPSPSSFIETKILNWIFLQVYRPVDVCDYFFLG